MFEQDRNYWKAKSRRERRIESAAHIAILSTCLSHGPSRSRGAFQSRISVSQCLSTRPTRLFRALHQTCRTLSHFLAICICIFSSQGHVSEHAIVLSISASVTDNYFRFAGQKQERVLLPVASTRIPSQTPRLHLVRTHSDFCLHCYHKLSTCCGALTRQKRHRCTQILEAYQIPHASSHTNPRALGP